MKVYYLTFDGEEREASPRETLSFPHKCYVRYEDFVELCRGAHVIRHHTTKLYLQRSFDAGRKATRTWVQDIGDATLYSEPRFARAALKYLDADDYDILPVNVVVHEA
jgi:hypothetical protein